MRWRRSIQDRARLPVRRHFRCRSRYEPAPAIRVTSRLRDECRGVEQHVSLRGPNAVVWLRNVGGDSVGSAPSFPTECCESRTRARFGCDQVRGFGSGVANPARISDSRCGLTLRVFRPRHGLLDTARAAASRSPRREELRRHPRSKSSDLPELSTDRRIDGAIAIPPVEASEQQQWSGAEGEVGEKRLTSTNMMFWRIKPLYGRILPAAERVYR